MSRLRPSSSFGVGFLTLLVWALAAGSAVFWGLRLGEGNPSLAVTAPGGSIAERIIDTRQVAQALGAGGAPVVVSHADLTSRLALRGVLTHGAQGAVLVAVDGQPARMLRVGDELAGVDGGWTLGAVTPHAALLVADGRQARIEMPAFDRRSRAGDAVAPSAGAQAGSSPASSVRLPAPPGRIGSTPMRAAPGARRQ